MALLITEEDVDRILSYKDSLVAVEEAFRYFGRGQVVAPPRFSIHVPAGTWRAAIASISPMGAVGVKAYTSFHFMPDSFRDEDRIVFLLYSSNDGRLLAIIGGYRLSQLRTGATSALAAKYLSRNETLEIGLIGSGIHARAELEGLAMVRDVKKVKVYSPNKEHREKFVKEMGEKLRMNVLPARTVEEAVENSDIISTVTTSSTPLFEADLLKPGIHINAVGANSPERQEIPPSVIQYCHVVVTDYKEQAKIESGNLIAAVKSGMIAWHQVIELGDIVSGRLPGRQEDSQPTLFVSNGFIIEDVAVAMKAYELAIEQGLGKDVSLRATHGF